MWSGFPYLGKPERIMGRPNRKLAVVTSYAKLSADRCTHSPILVEFTIQDQVTSTKQVNQYHSVNNTDTASKFWNLGEWIAVIFDFETSDFHGGNFW